MTIYLACTVRGDRGAVAVLRALCGALAARGHHVLTTHLLDDDVDAAEGTLTEQDVYTRDIAWLDACDVLIAEASGSSYGVGFEVGYVLGRDRGQRVLLLYRADRGARVSRLIAGNAHPRCRVHAYRDGDDLVRFVESAIG
ncbi:MAG TPA: nucleoside 2-deoxyribosyltransferase [Vicinamibacterales bacterium]|nr:nucleoside 2-deoxyribosyltransferase [Vicinamibacterales bacterium]